MPDATELVATADLKSYLQITGITYDTILASIKASVEAWMKIYCRDPFLVAQYTEYYDGHGSSRLHVRHYPITSIDEVNIDSDRTFAVATKVATADIIQSDQSNSEGVIELFGEVFSQGQKNVKVLYKAGYSSVPADLQLAVKIICAREFLIQDKKMAGIVSQSVSDKTLSLNLEEIPRNAWTILQAYRRPLV
jgi:hypothetical protein